MYDNEERIARKEKIFEEIYNTFYEDLPEEEQLCIDLEQAIIDIHLTKKIDFGEGILSDYFFQVQHKKTFYTENDLLLVELYVYCYPPKTDKESEEIFENILSKILSQVDYSFNSLAFLLNKILIVAMAIFELKKQYHRIIELVKASNVIMQNNLDFSKKPIVDMLEGKYLLFAKDDEATSKEKYLDASKLAKLQGDSFLSDKIIEEWIKDLESKRSGVNI